MTTYYDVPADLLITGLAEKMTTFEKIVAPEWASQVKTGTHRERPPVQDDWWHTRAASILRKVAIKGPIGTNGLIENSMNSAGTVNRGRVVSPVGQALLDEVAHSVRGAAEERYPGLERY